MKLACIDNHILSWAILGQTKDVDPNLVARAKLFIRLLEKRKVRIVVPAVVVGEILVCVELARHDVFRQVLATRFVVEPYDAAAAACAAKIRQLNKNIVAWCKDQNKTYTHAKIAADHQIAGIAISKKVDVLYTQDNGLMMFAKPHIATEHMPQDIGEQLSLLEEAAKHS